MGQQTTALFTPVPDPTVEVVARIVDRVTGSLKGHFAHYYAHVRYEPADDDYVFDEETVDLKGRDDLLARVRRDTDAVWAFYLPVVFYPARVLSAVYRDASGTPGTTLLLLFDPVVTRAFQEEQEFRMPFALLLAGIANAIGSDAFVSGASLDTWLPLRAERLANPDLLTGAFVIGWRPNTLIGTAVVQTLGVGAARAARTTLGYHLLIRDD